MPFRLEWRRTERPEDFTCHAPEGMIGRIYSEIAPGGEVKRWFWTVNGYLPEANLWLSEHGRVDTKNEAAQRVEEAYFRVKGD
jgi:hypothetical protein